MTTQSKHHHMPLMFVITERKAIATDQLPIQLHVPVFQIVIIIKQLSQE